MGWQKFSWLALLAATLPLAAADAPPPPATFDQLNAVLGLPLWSSDSLGDDTAIDTARRLRWPQESQTTQDSSYRLYPRAELMVLGAHPYSLALYGDSEGKVEQISMVFANLGDIQDAVAAYATENHLPLPKGAAEQTLSPAEETALAVQLKQVIEKENRDMTKQLTTLLGPPRRVTFGEARVLTESITRWDWNGQAILLSAPKDQYLALRIMSVAAADGKDARHQSASTLRNVLAQRVEHHSNGDVIIGDIPMVSQGPKGYCVLATSERILRYVGIPADMYTLAMAEGAMLGGGTTFPGMVTAIDNVARTYGRHVESVSGRVQISDVARKINQGMPLLWGVFVVDSLEADISARSAERLITTDWAAYKKSLTSVRNNARLIKTSVLNGHVRMIIGYNEKTNEIAISDSWGKKYTERWMTVEEAQAISQDKFFTITW